MARAERPGHGGAALAGALNELGLWCKDSGRYAEAREHYLRALRILQSSGHPDPDDVATLYHNLGGIEHARGHYARGVVLARHGLALRLDRPEADQPALAKDLVALAALVDGTGRHAEAEELYLAGLAIFEHLAGDWRLEIAVALSGLGACYAGEGRLDEAAGLLERAAAIKRGLLGPRDPGLAVTLNNLAVTRRRQGDGAGAAAAYAEALGILQASLGADHPTTLRCRRNSERAILPAE